MKQGVRQLFFLVIGIFIVVSASAQKDSTKKRSVDITSTFKPVLKQAAKINFNPSPPAADTNKVKLTYDIPNQNLVLPYKPGSLKPLALNVDSAEAWQNSSYVKIGFGSLKTPYAQAAIAFGDGKTAGLNIYAKHVSSDGKREFQKFSNTQFKLAGYFKSGNNLEWNAGIGLNQDKTYKYGYQPLTLSFPSDSLKVHFQTIAGRISFHNINKTEFGLTYAPEIKIDVFGDYLKNNESNTVINLPLEKAINNEFSVKLVATFDLTRYTPRSKVVVNNTMYYISPSVIYKNGNINVEAGIRPSWDNKTFKMFPNVLLDFVTDDKRFNFQAGWTGYVRKTTYEYLSSINPWLYAPTNFKNTWIDERFAGFKGSVGEHFTYSAKAAFNKWTNQPLFVNDTTTLLGGKSFQVINERRINVINIGSEIGYNIGEKFSLVAGMTVNKYTGLKDNPEAYGLLPLELKAALRLQVIKDLWLKGDLYSWSGPQYRKKDLTPGKLSGAVDLNAGLEFKITKNLNVWTQFNNLFNKEYMRWNQYPVYGFNFVGGIVFSFDQINR